MIKLCLSLTILLGCQGIIAQVEKTVSIEDRYFNEQKAFAGLIAGYIYSDFPSFNSINLLLIMALSYFGEYLFIEETTIPAQEFLG